MVLGEYHQTKARVLQIVDTRHLFDTREITYQDGRIHLYLRLLPCFQCSHF